MEYPLLSILILTIDSRKAMLNRLLDNLNQQCAASECQIEICIDSDNGAKTKGLKRNFLLNQAKGKYLCFFDDDDIPSNNYIKLLTDGLKTNPDCCSLKGVITWNGVSPEIFEHSLKYQIWKTNDAAQYPNQIKYERPPNHLNAIRSAIAKTHLFPEINHGEDEVWSMALQNSRMIKTEYYIEEVLYHYQYKSK